MRRVVDDLEVVGVDNPLNGIDIAGSSVAMNWHDSGDLWGDGGFDFGGV
jgi:hypothetical protein